MNETYETHKLTQKPRNFDEWNLITIGNIIIWVLSKLLFLNKFVFYNQIQNVRNAVIQTIN